MLNEVGSIITFPKKTQELHLFPDTVLFHITLLT